ncbi:MAG: carboxymuconolactone decarboxylase family protein [Thiohalospira sp.]
MTQQTANPAHWPVHDLTTAPEAARPALEAVQKQFGAIPNIFGVMAGSPALLDGYLALTEAYEGGELTPAQRDVILIAASMVNGCGYCVAAHSTMSSLPREELEALRAGEALSDPALEALRRVTRAAVERQGWVDEALRAELDAAGLPPSAAGEILVGVALKTMSNYTNHQAGTPLDSFLAKWAWEPAA